MSQTAIASTKNKKKMGESSIMSNETGSKKRQADKKGMSQDIVRPKTSGQPKNSFVDEKNIVSKKYRAQKEQELKKHQMTVYNLKRKLAKQIVDKSANIEEFK